MFGVSRAPIKNSAIKTENTTQDIPYKRLLHRSHLFTVFFYTHLKVSHMMISCQTENHEERCGYRRVLHDFKAGCKSGLCTYRVAKF